MAGEQSLVRLAEDLGTVLLDWARSSSSSSKAPERRVVVNKDSILVFDPDKPQLDLELTRLARILKNASNHAGYIFDYLNNSVPVGGRVRLSSVRKAVTIRDGLYQMSLLVNGIDLDELDSCQPPELDDEFLSMREAEIYNRIKHVQSHAGSLPDIWNGLESILCFIRENQPMPIKNGVDNDDS